MSDDKIAGAPTPPIEPEPASVAPTATPSASEAQGGQPAPAMPAGHQSAPMQLSLADAVKAAQPALPDPVAPAPAEPDSEIATLRAELAAELERTKAAREAVEAISARTSERNRLAYLRQMGATDSLSDAHLMTLAPQVDPDTSDGAAALQAWRDANGALFNVQQGGATVTAKLVEGFKNSEHGTFGADFHRAQMRAVFGGE